MFVHYLMRGDYGFFNAITAFETVYFWSPVNIALSEVARVLREGGCFLISLEASDPELEKMWTERIDGTGCLYSGRIGRAVA